jgi:hypothetical protein
METTYYAMNPWWERKDVDSGIDRLDYLERLPALIGRKQIEVIVGGRRMDKALVLEPESLREEIRAESEALLGKYGGSLLTEEKPSVA